MQDALVGATDKKNGSHEKDGELFYDYEVTGAVRKLLHTSEDICWPTKTVACQHHVK